MRAAPVPPAAANRCAPLLQRGQYLRGYPDLLDVREIPEQVVHQSVDPDVVIVEFSVNGIVVATGRPYHMRYIAVITARDGEIQHYRDYWSPAAAAEAMGGAAELNSAFSGGSDE